MLTSVDGKVTGDFLQNESCQRACEIYYEINRNTKSNGFICGRVTMEGSFTNCWYPDLSHYEAELDSKGDCIFEDTKGFYAVAFDTNGKLGWKSNRIIDPDGDPGYDGARIIEVLSENVDKRYLSYLKSMQIPYIFAGKDKIDVKTALLKLKEKFLIDTLLLEGGSIINGAFKMADAVDELSLVVVPVTADSDDKPLFYNSTFSEFRLENCCEKDGVLILNYKKK